MKKTISMLLAVLMLLSLFPVMSVAADGLTPADFGWGSDTANWNYWTTDADGNFALTNCTASAGAGENCRIWKNILTDTTFTWTFDLKVDRGARIYMNILATVLEIGINADGGYWIPAVGNWLVSTDDVLHFELIRDNGGNITGTVTPTGGAAAAITLAPTTETATVEIGMWNYDNNGFAISNMTYVNEIAHYPNEFGWCSDTANWSYWTAEDAGNFALTNIDASNAAGENCRCWKDILADSTFTWNFDLKVDPNARVYFNALGTTFEVGTAADGAYWIPQTGAWLVSSDGFVNFVFTRDNGGKVNVAVTPTGGATYTWSFTPAAETATVEFGMWNSANNGFAIRNMTYADELPPVVYTPADFGWCSDTASWNYWTTDADGNFALTDRDASFAAGENCRVWKNILNDTTFTWTFDLKVDRNARIYMSILATVVEIGVNADGGYWIPAVGSWLSSSDDVLHFELFRDNGGNITGTVTPTGGAAAAITIAPTTESATVEIGMWNSDNNGFAISNMTYADELPPVVYTPADFGWASDTASWNYWTTDADGNFALTDRDASFAAGENCRVWKNILVDSAFAWSFDLKVDRGARIYMSILATVVEIGINADGGYWIPAVGSWLTSSDDVLHFELVRNNGGDITGTVTPTGGAAAAITIVPTTESPTVEIGMWNSDNNGFSVSNMTYTAHVHSFTAGEIILPTCIAAGYTVYTCSCGATENRDSVPALGHDYIYTNNGDDHTVTCSRCAYEVTEAHTFVEGVCVCGAEEVTENIDNNLTFATVNLQLESYIGADFFFLKTKVADYDSYYVRFTYPTADGDVTEDLPVEEYGKYFFAEHTVAAKEMSDTIQATIYAVKDGETYYGPTTSWTLKDAMRAKFDGAKSTEADKALCVAILNYGAKAQARFSYNVEDLATSVLTAEEIATYLPAARAAVSVDATTSNGLTGVTFYKMALSAGSVTVLNVMFTKAAATDIADVECRISYTDRAGAAQVEVIDSFTASGSRYVALFNKLTAKQLGDTISITFYSKTSGEPISETKTFSEESYIALNPSANEAQTALYTALIQYADAAAAKFA